MIYSLESTLQCCLPVPKRDDLLACTNMCLIRTAHPCLYVLMMCMIRTAHPRFYCTPSLVLHIVNIQGVIYERDLKKGIKLGSGQRKRVHFESSRTSMPFNKLLGVDTPGIEQFIKRSAITLEGSGCDKRKKH